MCVCVFYLKPPGAGALWGQKAGMEGAVDVTSDVRLRMGLNLRHTHWERQRQDYTSLPGLYCMLQTIHMLHTAVVPILGARTKLR